MKDTNDSVLRWHERATAAVLDERSLALRRSVVEVLECSRRGHLGASLSLIEILRVLYDDVLRLDAGKPDWPDRDRCILSKGHGCIPLYVLLAEKGFFPREELRRFCAHDGLLGGHPDSTKIPGVEASTGSLGHGLAVGVGMAMAVRNTPSRPRVFVVLGDGEMNEGSVWEACLSAGNRGLDNLVLLVDYNKYQSYDSCRAVQNLEPLGDKLASFGLAVRHVNGHDLHDLRAALASLPLTRGRPTALVCHTVKGKGVPFAENNLAWHHKSKIGDGDIRRLYAALER